MATSHRNLSADYIEYNQQIWGDLIYGTKEQLQLLGIGIDVQFPVPDHPKRTVRVKDPRGFPTKIKLSEYMGEGVYSASIHFPGRDNFYDSYHKSTSFAFGVGVIRATWYDEFTGIAEALAAAGLVQTNQLPGQPGMGKVQVTLSPDGLLDSSTNSHKRHQPGQVRIKRAAKSLYTVLVIISDEEEEIRRDARKLAERAWEAKMNALPRPAPLTVESVRSHIIQEKIVQRQGNVIHACFGKLLA